MTANPALANLSDDEAKKEHDDIQREIAEKKGIKPDESEKKPESEIPKEDVEPADEPEKPEPEKPKEEPEKPDEPEPEAPERKGRYIPLAKFQDLKRQAKEASEAKDSEIAQLKKDLEDAKTTKDLGNVIKEFAEKHNVSEEYAKDMLNLAKAAMPKPDPQKEAVLGKAEVLIKKQEAIEAFENEFADLVKDSPDALELKSQIRAKAYENGNLDKSLFEIYHRHVKPTAPVQRKTGEVSRGPTSTRHSPPAFDPKTIAAKLSKGEKGVLDGLKPKELDEVFEYMEKQGSRYQ